VAKDNGGNLLKIVGIVLTMLMVGVTLTLFIARASDNAAAAMKKTGTLEAAMVKLAQSQLITNQTANQNADNVDKNSGLIKKLSDAQIEQKVDIKYIKKGIEQILKSGS